MLKTVSITKLIREPKTVIAELKKNNRQSIGIISNSQIVAYLNVAPVEYLQKSINKTKHRRRIQSIGINRIISKEELYG